MKVGNRMNRVSKIIELDYARKLNLTGKNVGVAILDTGIGFHPDLFSSVSASRLVHFLDTVNGEKNYYDDNGHGTHIAGIIGGTGTYSPTALTGIAPNCHFVGIKVLNERGEGSSEQVIAGIHWLLEHHREYGIRIVNISVGSTRSKRFDETSPLVRGINKLWEAGLCVLTASGNHGPTPSSIGAPGNSRKIITVGSSDSDNHSFESDYSGRGPTYNCIKKPDIVAPGSKVLSCYPMYKCLPPNTAPLPLGRTHNLKYYNGTAYLARTGTSMSTPVVTGCIALLLEQRPWMTNREIKLHLRNTALHLGLPHNQQGWGLINCRRLFAL